MPNYAYLSEDIRCKCGATLTDLVRFQWGYCPGYGPREGWIYSLNSPIKWRSCQDGSIPTWAYFENYGGSNIGNNRYHNLIIIGESMTGNTCEMCGATYGGIVIEVKDEVITSVQVFEVGEFDSSITITIIDGDNHYPKAEWEDHLMDRISC